MTNPNTNLGYDKERLKRRIRYSISYFVGQYGCRPWIVDALREVAIEIEELGQRTTLGVAIGEMESPDGIAS
jgi:hypothetical protein